MKKTSLVAMFFGILFQSNISFSQSQMPQMGGNFRPSYESYRLDKFITQDDASYTGDLNFSIPVLTVPGRHGHNFDIKLTYNSNVTERQFASWVGLGWNLELGCVERTVNGRTDEPNQVTQDPNSFLGQPRNGDTYRGNLGGRFNYSYTYSNLSTNVGFDSVTWKDQADLYQLSIDGGGMEIVPFPNQKGATNPVDGSTFLPVQYKPWTIGATQENGSGKDGSIYFFTVVKEDGTQYTFGDPGGGNDYVKCTYNPTYSYISSEEYEFPYRWNLSAINYADGSKTQINYGSTYNLNNLYYRRYESVMIDRTFNNSNGIGNYFGNTPGYNLSTPPDQYDYALYSYSYPTSLYTDTHYAVFKTSITMSDSTARMCRLDTLILYEKNTNKELKRVIFYYAKSPSAGPVWGPNNASTSQWHRGERLDNNQLTLDSIIVTDMNDIKDQGISAGPLQYSFTYTVNAQINLEYITTWGSQWGTQTPEWPGYFYSAVLDSAWRIKTVSLPTGGTYTYTWGTENVTYDPEGHSYNDSWGSGGAGGNYFNTDAQPRCILQNKTFDDGMGGTPRTWTYSYSPDVVYDPPSGAYASGYIPLIYRGNYYRPDELYLDFRGCGVGHRWVQVNNPDGTYKKTYFTSSYQKSDADPAENQADVISTSAPPMGNTVITSRAGCRGLVWKEEVGQQNQGASASTHYYYSYVQEGGLSDPYDYYGMLTGSDYNEYILRTCMWARLDSTSTTQDAVTATSTFQYNSTPRDPGTGNGLLSIKTDEGSNVNRQTKYVYASSLSRYSSMYNLGMLSQIYSTIITNSTGGIDMSKEFTTWGQFSSHWLPLEKFVWRGLPTDVTAPTDTSGSNVILQQSYNYDNSGYSDLTSSTDANGNVTTYYYSNDTLNPRNNDVVGLSKGYVTDVTEAISSPLLQKSYQYDQFGNTISETDENGNVTRAQYDNLGRIATVINPSGQKVNQFSYYLNNGIWSYGPDFISAISYRSSTDNTIATSFFDGAGYEKEKLLSFGNADLITPTTYDPMWRVNQAYKPYQVSLSTPHTYDPNDSSNDVSYYDNNVYVSGFSDNYPYTQNQYYLDGTGRIQYAFPQGSAWQNGHYVKYYYSANVSGEVSGYSQNTLYRTLVLDENQNGVRRFEFKNKFGNLVETAIDSNSLNLLKTQNTYDVVGDLLQSTPPNGSSYNTSYTYDKLNQLTQKISPDAGTANYLYDKNGNLRLIQDANHAGSRNNFTASQGPITNPVSGNFSLNEPGMFTISGALLYGMGGSPSVVVKILANGVAVLSLTTNSSSSVYKSGYLPKGSYSYSASITGGSGYYFFSASCTNSYEMVYNKYDALNRLVETGEYSVSPTAASCFRQDSADAPVFPSSNTLVTRKFFYDTPSVDPNATGQTNIKGKLSYSESYLLGSLAIRNSYSYDNMGRVAWMVESGFSSYSKKLYYSYDLQGNTTQTEYSDLDQATHPLMYTNYAYDQAGRLNNVQFYSYGGTTQEAAYNYFASGKPSQLTLGSTAATVTYNYNERDWLSRINSGNFHEHLGYNTQAEIDNVQPVPLQWNGNISWLSYYMNVSGINYSTAGWTHTYDRANRLTSGDFGYSSGGTWQTVNSYDLMGLTYDNNGNVQHMLRWGSNTSTPLENLSFTYQANSNRLLTDISSFPYPYPTYTFTYDGNGNVNSDSYRGIVFEIYNIDNLPVAVYQNNGTVIQYGYDANGKRMEKVINGSTFNFYINGKDGETEAVSLAPYHDNVIYNVLAGSENVAQVKWTWTGGSGGSFNYFYYLKDHLGDIKMVLNSSGGVDSWNDYYPFGMQMDSRNGSTSADGRYKFTSKERDAESGYDYFGARYYDSRIGRWMSVDPMKEKFPSWSPYVYALDNSIRNDDPNGRGAKDRVKAASVLLAGISYNKEAGQTSLRTEWTPEAMQFMDCSEIANRILYMDDITHGVMDWSTINLKAFFSNPEKFSFSSKPQYGDFALWFDNGGGHVDIVTEVEKNGKVKYAGAWNEDVKSGERGPWTSGKGSPHKFIGYFRPTHETPDDKLSTINSLEDYVNSLSGKNSAVNPWPTWWQTPVRQILDYYLYNQSDVTSSQNNTQH